MKFTLRQVDIHDRLVFEAIQAMHHECFDDYRWHGVKPGDGTIFWIAVAEGIDAGFCALTPSVRWDKTGYLSRAGVRPAYRGHGLQKRMIRKRLAAARAMGWQWAVTDTLHDNPHSQNNLIECGFRAYTPLIPWGIPTAVYWRRKL